jgi:hypothetical protein
MWMSSLAGFDAGFFGGNGLPYYLAGSTGEGVNPSPFPNTPRVNVVVGWFGLAAGVAAWQFTDTQAHGGAACASGLLGALVVGLIHARVWRADPWNKHR